MTSPKPAQGGAPGRQAGQRREDSSRSHAAGATVSPWEWVTAGLGALLVAAVLGIMVTYALRHGEAPPQVSIAVQSIRPNGDGYLVTFKAFNHGDQTAAQLKVEGALVQGGEEVETNEVTFDYLPSHSERQGGVFFRHDPARYDLHFDVKGYAQP